MASLLLKNVVLPDGQPADLRLEDGLIAAVQAGLTPRPGEPVEEGRGLLALPAAIDMHVHFRQPGMEQKETLLTGGQAAVKGGVATVADMPNTSPMTTSYQRLQEKLALAEGTPVNLLVNFGAARGQSDQLKLAAAHPAVKAVKVYLGPSTGTGGVGGDVAEEYFAEAARLGLPVMAHAEDPALIEAAQTAHPAEARFHHLLRPLEAELASVKRALDLTSRHGNKLYLCHITCAQVVDLVEASGLRKQVFVEATPHHLLLSTQVMEGHPNPNLFKVNPPVRPEEVRAGLMAALHRLDTLGSDHAPHTLEEKAQPYPQAPSGMPGVEYLLPLALSWWKEGRISLERLVELTSANAARFFGLNKGRLAVGFDADLVLVDERARWRVGQGDDRVASKCGWTPYQGMALGPRPVVTLARGQVVWKL